MRITQWSSDNIFIELPKGPLAAVTIYNSVYIFSSATGLNETHIATLDDNLNVQNWKVVKENAPIPYEKSIFVSTPDRVYLLGGVIDDKPLNTVYYLPILTNKTLGKWKKSKDLPFAISCSSAVYFDINTGDRRSPTKSKAIYLFGGLDANNKPLDKIYKLELNERSIITKISELDLKLPEPVYNCRAILNKNYIYLFGGNNGTNPTNRIIKISLDEENPFVKEIRPMPLALEKPAVAILGDKLYIIGGKTIGGCNSTKTFVSFFNSNGDLPKWADDLPLPYTLDDMAVLYSKTSFYIIGGLLKNNQRLILNPKFSSDKESEFEFIDDNTKNLLNSQVKHLNILIIILILLILTIFLVFQFV